MAERKREIETAAADVRSTSRPTTTSTTPRADEDAVAWQSHLGRLARCWPVYNTYSHSSPARPPLLYACPLGWGLRIVASRQAAEFTASERARADGRADKVSISNKERVVRRILKLYIKEVNFGTYMTRYIYTHIQFKDDNILYLQHVCVGPELAVVGQVTTDSSPPLSYLLERESCRRPGSRSSHSPSGSMCSHPQKLLPAPILVGTRQAAARQTGRAGRVPKVAA